MSFFSITRKGIGIPALATLFASAPFLTVHASPSTDEVIAQARDYLGGDEVLDGVRSIYYSGVFETREGARGEVEIVFQKPLFQRVTTVRDDLKEVTGLSHYDGWRKLTEREDDSNWTIVFLEPDQIRELQANTWENLNFFKGIERRRGSVENHGLVDLDGESCVKLTFRHPGGVYFDRYFDAETGRLILTEASSGGQIREEGDQVVDGIRFPEAIVMYENGEQTNRIQFEEITVNREFDEEMFEVPSMAPARPGEAPIQMEDELLDIPSPVEP